MAMKSVVLCYSSNRRLIQMCSRGPLGLQLQRKGFDPSPKRGTKKSGSLGPHRPESERGPLFKELGSEVRIKVEISGSLAGSAGRACNSLDLRGMSLSPTLDVGITKKNNF